MYDLPELEPYTDQLWVAIATRLAAFGLDTPPALQRPAALQPHWHDQSLLLSQTCGYPLLSLPAHIRIVATPCYRAEGCNGASYRSALVVRADDPAGALAALRGRRCAINGWDSNSGMNLLRACVAPLAEGRRFFDSIVLSGSHLRSMALVADGSADLAAIDCVTLALVRRHRPAAFDGLRILDWTPSAPGLPLITAGDDATLSALRSVLRSIQADHETRPVLDALLIDCFEVLPDGAYTRIAALEQAAADAGYPILC